MSPVKNIKILQYSASQLKYFTRSSIKSNINSNCNVVNDVFYDGRNNYKRTLDIYYTESYQSLKPIIILFYSRNWSTLDKRKWEKWAKIIESRGYVVIIPDFTSVSHGKLFEMATDFLKCLQWVNANVGQFGGDVSRIYILGVETGAHIAMHSILDSIFNSMHSLIIKNLILPPIYGVILIDGIFDLIMHYSFECLNGIEDISVIPNLLMENERFSKLHPRGIFNLIKTNPQLIDILPNHWMFLVSNDNKQMNQSQSQIMAAFFSSIRKHVQVERFDSLTNDDLILSVDGLLIERLESFSNSSHEKDSIIGAQMYAKAAYI